MGKKRSARRRDESAARAAELLRARRKEARLRRARQARVAGSEAAASAPSSGRSSRDRKTSPPVKVGDRHASPSRTSSTTPTIPGSVFTPAGSARVGDIVSVYVPFTGQPGPRDTSLSGKDRPCLVVAIRANRSLVIRPIHSLKERRRGSAIVAWQQADLKEPSVVLDETLIVSPEDVTGFIGRISASDAERLGLYGLL
ncbi:MAG: hypothetical protein KatS3mg008_2160 [Acidimicrobiales bacterium]|nr:MAG: hypothetical protein KatS3mg008_2160 [Acidimicrobiales bacterium]